VLSTTRNLSLFVQFLHLQRPAPFQNFLFTQAVSVRDPICHQRL